MLKLLLYYPLNYVHTTLFLTVLIAPVFINRTILLKLHIFLKPAVKLEVVPMTVIFHFWVTNKLVVGLGLVSFGRLI